MFKNKIVITLIIFLVSFVFRNENFIYANVDIFGKHGIVIEYQTGDVIYDKNGKVEAFPASITKVLTALLLMENVSEGELIRFSSNAIFQVKSNSQVEFKEGELITREDALKALMVISANDVAVAIAEHISGSEQEFGKLMTEKAKKIGALNSNFVTASGLHDPQHKTTAYDIALITREAIKNKDILNAMGSKSETIETNLQKVTLYNPSKIFEDLDTLGGKTGFTTPAGNTLVKIDEIEGKRVIAVVMASNLLNIYEDIKKISNYSINKLEKIKIIDKEEWNTSVFHEEKELVLLPEESLEVVTLKGNEENYKTEIVINNEVFEQSDDIFEGQVIGKVELKKNGQKIEEVNLFANQDFKIKSYINGSGKYSTIIKISIAILLPFILYASFLIFYNKKIRKPA